MTENLKKFSRREFLRKTTVCTAAAIAGTNTLFNPLVHAVQDGVLPAGNTPQIAIIIDDVGYNCSRLLPFLDLGVPITFSILPRIPYSQKLAEKIHAEGHEIMLHQPMQPQNASINPGPGALFLDQDSAKRHKIIEENISNFPFAVGVNNHMGSLFTESKQKMEETLQVFKQRGLFFIDSKTTSHSIAYKTAKDLGIQSSFRDVFIDPGQGDNVIARQLARLTSIALRYGQAIGIGHPKPETLCILESYLKDLETSGISMVYVSDVLA